MIIYFAHAGHVHQTAIDKDSLVIIMVLIGILAITTLIGMVIDNRTDKN